MAMAQRVDGARRCARPARRSLAVLMGLLGCLALGTPTEADTSTWADPSGDAGDCRADLTQLTVRTTSGPAIGVDVRTSCGLPQSTSQWPAGTELVWELEVDGDEIPDWSVRVIGGRYEAWVAPAGSSPSPNGCQPSQVLGDATWSGVRFGTRCIGSPPAIRSRVSVRWAGGAVDVAPDGGGFGPFLALPDAPRPATTRHGYWMVGRTGDTYAFGDAVWYGNTSAPADVVDIEPTLSGNGYWTVDSLGHVYAFGDAKPLSLPQPEPGWSPLRPGERITSLSKQVDLGATAAQDRVDELLLFSDLGRVHVAGGYASPHGDLGLVRLNGPVVDSVARSDGLGYWMVASDGGIFTFGLARFHGSMGDQRLNSPVQSLVPDPDGTGYWLVAGDGGIFAFDAPFLGSMGDTKLNKPVVGMVSSGSGYLMVASDGGIFAFGGAPFHGSLGDHPPAQPVVAVAALDV